MDIQIPPRLFVLLAREAPVGIIFRRGPTKWTRLCKWDTRADTVVRGQWFHGRAYERRSDLSPDGKYLVYFAMDGQWQSETKGSFTVVSRPPYWTPLTIWPHGNQPGGGGFFIDQSTLYLNTAAQPLHGRGPQRLAVKRDHPFEHPGKTDDLGVYYPRLLRDGWTILADEQEAPSKAVIWTRMAPNAPYRLVKRSHATLDHQWGRGCFYDEYALEKADGTSIEMPNVEWADWDQAGRLVFAREGKLLSASIADSTLTETEIVDLNADVPEHKPPPAWASRW